MTKHSDVGEYFAALHLSLISFAMPIASWSYSGLRRYSSHWMSSLDPDKKQLRRLLVLKPEMHVDNDSNLLRYVVIDVCCLSLNK